MSKNTSPAVQKLATQIYLSGKCKSLKDAYEQAEAQLSTGDLFGKDFLKTIFGEK